MRSTETTLNRRLIPGAAAAAFGVLALTGSVVATAAAAAGPAGQRVADAPAPGAHAQTQAQTQVSAGGFSWG